MAKKKRYDATMRDLFDPAPAAWLEFFGVPVPDPGQAQVIDSNACLRDRSYIVQLSICAMSLFSALCPSFRPPAWVEIRRGEVQSVTIPE